MPRAAAKWRVSHGGSLHYGRTGPAQPCVRSAMSEQLQESPACEPDCQPPQADEGRISEPVGRRELTMREATTARPKFRPFDGPCTGQS